jgi:hypothetical protein
MLRNVAEQPLKKDFGDPDERLLWRPSPQKVSANRLVNVKRLPRRLEMPARIFDQSDPLTDAGLDRLGDFRPCGSDKKCQAVLGRGDGELTFGRNPSFEISDSRSEH